MTGGDSDRCQAVDWLKKVCQLPLVFTACDTTVYMYLVKTLVTSQVLKAIFLRIVSATGFVCVQDTTV